MISSRFRLLGLTYSSLVTRPSFLPACTTSYTSRPFTTTDSPHPTSNGVALKGTSISRPSLLLSSPHAFPSLSLSSSSLLTFQSVPSSLLQSRTVQFQQTRTLKGKRDRFFILKERPVGPFKKLAPGVKLGKRVGKTANYRRIVHYPEDGKYTIKKLNITKLGGRDPETGRKVIAGVGGGCKQKYRWIDWFRLPKDWDPEGPDLVERIIKVCYDPCRDAKIIMSSYGNRLRWQIATENMKAGDLIRTSGKIPSMPVKPVEGDSYPLGALPLGTTICLLQQLPFEEKVEMFHGKDCGKILRRSGDRVIVKSNNNLDYSMDQRCQCVVGKVSIHPLKACHIGSPNRMRWMGIAPRSGLWQRKTGRFGRKIKKPPPVKEIRPEKPPRTLRMLLHSDSEGLKGRARGRKRPEPRREYEWPKITYVEPICQSRE